MHATSIPSNHAPLGRGRNTRIIATVIALHGGALWALHSGLLQRVVERVVPTEVLIDMSPAEAQPAQPAPAQPTPTLAASSATPSQTRSDNATRLQAAPVPLAVTTATPEPSATALTPVVEADHNRAPSSIVSPSAAPAAVAPPTPPARLMLPSSDADYLQNPRPVYPPVSKRMGEQGQVVIRTLIGSDGSAQQAQIKHSSGFDRLDQAAMATALRWKYVPGKRAGVAEAMWFDMPFNWVLQ